jgi:hypothetical protein
MEPTMLAVLQAVRLKGRVTAADAAAATGLEEARADEALAALAAEDLVKEAGERRRLTPEGRERLTQELAAERATIDQGAMTGLYDGFEPHNTAFKQLASDWQQRDGVPNDHTDAAYDQRVLDRLAVLHEGFLPVAEQAAALVPRLAPYLGRFVTALERVQAGDHTFFLRPIIDSYHTIWFELHEELISLMGRTRQGEALAGRAE